MHLGFLSKGSPAKYWWEDQAVLTRCFTKNEFVMSRPELWAHQDEPAGSNPPTWGEMYHPTRPHYQPQPEANVGLSFQDAVMTRKGGGREMLVPNSGTPGSGQTLVS